MLHRGDVLWKSSEAVCNQLSAIRQSAERSRPTPTLALRAQGLIRGTGGSPVAFSRTSMTGELALARLITEVPRRNTQYSRLLALVD